MVFQLPNLLLINCFLDLKDLNLAEAPNLYVQQRIGHLAYFALLVPMPNLPPFAFCSPHHNFVAVAAAAHLVNFVSFILFYS